MIEGKITHISASIQLVSDNIRDLSATSEEVQRHRQRDFLHLQMQWEAMKH